MTDLLMERDAVLSDDGLHRYLLRRAWDHAKPRALFIMLNPSTADAEVDDATIRSCIRLCRSWQFGSFEVVNLFSFRATNPAELIDASDPIGPDCGKVMSAAFERCDLYICAWGTNVAASWHPKHRDRARMVLSDLRSYRRPAIYCLGTTKSGAPKHPLYIKTGTGLEVFHE